MPLLRTFRDRITLLFFRSFFRLLLIAVAVGEWVCVTQPLRFADVELPLWVHAGGALAFYTVNLAFVRLPQHTGTPVYRGVLRTYSAFAFTSVFGAIFLGLNTLLWGTVEFLTQQVALAAGAHSDAVVSFTGIGRDWSSMLGLATLSVLFVYGYTFGAQRLTLTRLPLRLRHATPPLRGVRIVQISDIHIGRYMAPETLAEYVEQVNQLDADIVVITGDILDNLSAIPDGFPVLGRLRARHGVFAILGNHDFYAGADEVAEALRQMTDFTVLRDELARVEINGAPLYVAGVDDMGRDWARGVIEHPGLTRLLPSLPEDGPIILLSHRPDLFPQASAAGIDLVLSGHTHGGQISLPSLGGRPVSIARFITHYDRGLYEDGGSYLYVNRGIGCTGQRIRLFAPREIGVIEIGN